MSFGNRSCSCLYSVELILPRHPGAVQGRARALRKSDESKHVANQTQSEFWRDAASVEEKVQYLPMNIRFSGACKQFLAMQSYHERLKIIRTTQYMLMERPKMHIRRRCAYILNLYHARANLNYLNRMYDI